MSVVRINVLEVPAARAEVLEQRFAARAGEVEKVDGFESFELLRPTDGTDRYLVVTRWRDQEAFEAWMSSQAFQKGHAQAGGGAPAGGPPAGGPPSGEQPAGGHPGGGPAATGSQLWSFDVVTSATKA